MKKYELVHLNKGLRLSREKDLAEAESIINQMISQGYELQQIVSPGDSAGALIGVFFTDSDD